MRTWGDWRQSESGEDEAVAAPPARPAPSPRRREDTPDAPIAPDHPTPRSGAGATRRPLAANRAAPATRPLRPDEAFAPWEADDANREAWEEDDRSADSSFLTAAAPPLAAHQPHLPPFPAAASSGANPRAAQAPAGRYPPTRTASSSAAAAGRPSSPPQVEGQRRSVPLSRRGRGTQDANGATPATHQQRSPAAPPSRWRYLIGVTPGDHRRAALAYTTLGLLMALALALLIPSSPLQSVVRRWEVTPIPIAATISFAAAARPLAVTQVRLCAKDCDGTPVSLTVTNQSAAVISQWSSIYKSCTLAEYLGQHLAVQNAQGALSGEATSQGLLLAQRASTIPVAITSSTCVSSTPGALDATTVFTVTVTYAAQVLAYTPQTVLDAALAQMQRSVSNAETLVLLRDAAPGSPTLSNTVIIIPIQAHGLAVTTWTATRKQALLRRLSGRSLADAARTCNATAGVAPGTCRITPAHGARLTTVPANTAAIMLIVQAPATQ